MSQPLEGPVTLVVSPHRVVAQSLVTLLEKEGLQAHQKPQLAFDIVLEDLCRSALAVPQGQTLALVNKNCCNVIELLTLGYRGYLDEHSSAETLIKALRAVYKGEVWVERSVLGEVLDALSKPQLTEREREVMALVGQGLTNQKVAQKLTISERTVKSHLTRLYSKLGANNRAELILKMQSRAPLN